MTISIDTLREGRGSIRDSHCIYDELVGDGLKMTVDGLTSDGLISDDW